MIRRPGLPRRPAGPAGSDRETSPGDPRSGSSRRPTPVGRAASRRPPNGERAWGTSQPCDLLFSLTLRTADAIADFTNLNIAPASAQRRTTQSTVRSSRYE